MASLSIAGEDEHGAKGKKILGFLDLPGEIRNAIYRHALVFNGVKIVFPCKKNQMKGSVRLGALSQTSHEKLSDAGRKVQALVSAHHLLALLSVSKQIYRETKGIFWGENSFIFDDYVDAAIFVQRLGQERMDLIERFGVPTDLFGMCGICAFSGLNLAVDGFGRREHYSAVLRTFQELKQKIELRDGDNHLIKSRPCKATISGGLVDFLQWAGSLDNLSTNRLALTGSLCVRGCKRSDKGWRYVVERLESQNVDPTPPSPLVDKADVDLLRVFCRMDESHQELLPLFRWLEKTDKDILPFFRCLYNNENPLHIQIFQGTFIRPRFIKSVLWAERVGISEGP